MWILIFFVVIGCAEVDDRYFPDELDADSSVDAGVGFDAGAEVLSHEPKQQ